ncbi:hypothetical protein T492DRAFT_1127865 [Pavlovales sp. CCMP2436]|nr:hypothetical protein T492DRAFT_1127865 [Pavlovales sp. CCMP2436]
MYSALRLQPQVRKFTSPFADEVAVPLNTLASVRNGVFTFTNPMASANYVVSVTNGSNSAFENWTAFNFTATGFAVIVRSESGGAVASMADQYNIGVLISTASVDQRRHSMLCGLAFISGDGTFNHDVLGRLGPLALVDTLGTLLAAAVLARATKRAVLPVFAALLVAGEAAHVAFRVHTPVTRALGLLAPRP